MIIHFASTFDASVYPYLVGAAKAGVAGEFYAGPMRLVQELELRLGISSAHEAQSVRIEQYRQALKEHLERSPGAFYARSFERDEIGVAKLLLSWRDELRMGGFDFHIEKGPERIQTLAAVERAGGALPGTADRLQRLINFPFVARALQFDKIIIYEEIQLLHPVYGLLFDKLQRLSIHIEKGLAVDNENTDDLGKFKQVLQQKGTTGKMTLSGDGSLQVWKVNSEWIASDLLMQLCRNNSDFQPVIFNEGNNSKLCNAMINNSKGGIDWSINGNLTPHLQLLSLMPVLLYKPVDPHRLMELLTLNVSPISKKVRNKLARVVAGKPGIGSKEWKQAITDYLEELDDEKREKQRNEIDKWLNRAQSAHKEGAAVSDIIDLYTDVKNWSRGKAFAVKDEKQQELFRILSNCCVHLLDILNRQQEERMTLLKLHQYIEIVKTTGDICVSEIQVSSLPVFSRPGNITKPATSLVWWNFADVGQIPTYREKWSKEEIEFFRGNNIRMHKIAQQSKLWNQQVVKPALMAQSLLILILPDNVDGESVNPHPLYADLEANFENLNDIVFSIDSQQKIDLPGFNTPEMEIIETASLPEAKAYWKIDTPIEPGEKESYSSLNNLLYYPYRWVLERKAFIKPADILDIDEGNRFTGTLAHSVFEEYFENIDKELQLDEAERTAAVNEIIEKLLAEEGGILLNPGNEGMKYKFIETVIDSMHHLISHIKDNGWKVKGVEEYFKDITIAGTTLTGKIDLVLERNGEYAVIDLKWGSSKYRIEAIKDNKDLQLVIYARAKKEENRNKEYAHTGYYMINDRKLLARDNKAFTGANVVGEIPGGIDINDEIWNKMQATYLYRLNELKAGKIEVGEGIDIDKMKVFADQESLNLLAMPNDGKVKDTSSFNNFTSLFSLK